jgi:N-hydroxyarylamine O-acetyltransferase
MDSSAYLARIGYTDSTVPGAETLRKLHWAHMLTVPFENLDIGLQRKIECEAGASVRKIVEARRGGFCYELNGAFAWLLQTLGFRVTLLSAQVARANGTYSPEFDHLTLLVDLAQSWVADVGFGDSFVEPLLLSPGDEQEQRAEKFRITQQGGDHFQVERVDSADAWKVEYKFSLVPRELSDFAQRCHYHQTSPDSHFTQNRICSIATPQGRVTLAGLRLIITENGRREERELTEAEWCPALQRYFGVRL